MSSYKFAFYGSLRRGMENHDAYMRELSYLFSARLKGYKLYSKGQYPCAVRTGTDDAITVEVFETANEKAAADIHQLELDEGYFCDEVLVNGLTVKIYLYSDPGNYKEVPGGDWVTFFRQTGNSA